jgi:hypothetical protein
MDWMACKKIGKDIGINEHLSRDLHLLPLALPSISQFQRAFGALSLTFFSTSSPSFRSNLQGLQNIVLPSLYI